MVEMRTNVSNGILLAWYDCNFVITRGYEYLENDGIVYIEDTMLVGDDEFEQELIDLISLNVDGYCSDCLVITDNDDGEFTEEIMLTDFSDLNIGALIQHIQNILIEECHSRFC